MITLASFSEANDNPTSPYDRLGASYITGIGESFVPSQSKPWAGAGFYIAKVGSPTGNAYAKLYTAQDDGDGNYPADLLATSDPVDVSTLGTSKAIKDFLTSVGEQYALDDATTYVLTLEYGGGDASNYIIFGYTGNDDYAGGNISVNSGGWFGSIEDLVFYVYGVESATEVDVTKALAYAVKKSIGVTKGADYKVKNVIAQTKAIDYKIRLAVAVTKGIIYSLKTVLATTKTAEYRVKTTPKNTTKTLAYRVQTTPTAKSKLLNYTIKTIGSATKNLSYSVITESAISKDADYEIDNTLYDTYNSPMLYDDARSFYNGPALAVESTLALNYSIVTDHDNTKGLQYCLTVENAVTKDAGYRVLVGESLAKDLAYYIKTAIAKESALAYSVKVSTDIEVALDYKIANANQITKDLAYRVLTGSEVSKDIAYTVLSSNAVTKNLTYSIVDEILPITKDLVYKVVVKHADTKQVDYKLLVANELQKLVGYRISTSHATTKDLVYQVFAGGVVTINKGLEYVLAVDPYCSNRNVYTASDSKYSKQSDKYSKVDNYQDYPRVCH